jgi:hypothetical protein
MPKNTKHTVMLNGVSATVCRLSFSGGANEASPFPVQAGILYWTAMEYKFSRKKCKTGYHYGNLRCQRQGTKYITQKIFNHFVVGCLFMFFYSPHCKGY